MTALRVIECPGPWLAASVCGRLLADFGAVVQSLPAPATRSVFERAWLDVEKRPLEPTDLAASLPEADILLDGLGPGGLEALGLDPARLARDHGLIVCRISPFGQSGPYAYYQADEITLYATSGLMNSTGDGNRAPLNAGPPIASVTGGLYAFAAIGMALLRRARDGGGEVIDLSLQEAAAQNLEVFLTEFSHSGKAARRNNDRHNLVPWRTYPCADGEAAIIGGPIRNWKKAAPLFEAPELLAPPLDSAAGRIAHREKAEALISAWTRTQTKTHLFHTGQGLGLAWSYIATLPEVLACPQLAARAFFREVELEGRRLTVPGMPFHARPDALACRPVSAQSPTVGAAPLEGLTVLDFTHDWAGPHAAHVLADYGATVIKIEYPGRLDGMRGAYLDKINAHPRLWQLHRNKRSITLDLKDPEHLALARQLVAGADVVLENGRPGVMERLGLGYEALKAIRPDIILVSMAAFGASGPYQSYAGYGGTLEAISGAQSLTGYQDGETPYRVREMDVINGLFGLCAVMTALVQRAATGEGQFVDLSEYETSVWTLGRHVAEQSTRAEPLGVIGNRHPHHAPQGCYPCRGEDQWITLSIRNDTEWQRLAEWLGPEAQRPEWQSQEGRRSHADALDALIAQRTQAEDKHALTQRWQALGLAAGAVLDAADLHRDPHLAARDWWLKVEPGPLPGFPFRLERGGGRLRRPFPHLGEANAEYFGRLHPRGAAACPPLTPETLGTAYE